MPSRSVPEAVKHPALRAVKRRVRETREATRRRRTWPRFEAAVAELRRVAPADPSTALLDELRASWGDPDSAPVGLMLAAARAFRESEGDGVECGSGLSTVVLGTYAEALRRRWWALDQYPPWARRVSGALDRLGIAAASVLQAPLVPYDGYRWYRVPAELPKRIDFVLCDGPPADGEQVQLARYGLVPALGDRFTDGVTILLDDAARAGEQAVLGMWEREGMRWALGEASRQFAVVERA
jgi:Methyltransferase domain